MSFDRRLQSLPVLGLGLSTEYGAMRAPGTLNLFETREKLPYCAEFLELGVEASKGLDADSTRWVKAGLPTTYHFLDINLDDPQDFSERWIDRLRQIIEEIKPAWLCGDAGMWHVGPRAQGHMLLLPPVLSKDGAYALADGIVALRELTGLEVFPENPPGDLYVGDLHLLDFFAIVCDRAERLRGMDQGLLAALLAINELVACGDGDRGMSTFASHLCGQPDLERAEDAPTGHPFEVVSHEPYRHVRAARCLQCACSANIVGCRTLRLAHRAWMCRESWVQGDAHCWCGGRGCEGG